MWSLASSATLRCFAGRTHEDGGVAATGASIHRFGNKSMLSERYVVHAAAQ